MVLAHGLQGTPPADVHRGGHGVWRPPPDGALPRLVRQQDSLHRRRRPPGRPPASPPGRPPVRPRPHRGARPPWVAVGQHRPRRLVSLPETTDHVPAQRRARPLQHLCGHHPAQHRSRRTPPRSCAA